MTTSQIDRLAYVRWLHSLTDDVLARKYERVAPQPATAIKASIVRAFEHRVAKSPLGYIDSPKWRYVMDARGELVKLHFPKRHNSFGSWRLPPSRYDARGVRLGIERKGYSPCDNDD